MFGAAAPTMAEYYALLERAWNVPRQGRTRDFSTTAGQLAVSRNRAEQVLAISPEEMEAGLVLLARALGESDEPRVKQRIGIVRDALVFSKHGIETYLFNERLRAKTISATDEAQQALADLQQYARMVQQRDWFWSQARQRDDLLGETIRGLGDIKNYLIIDEFPQVDTNVASVALDVLDWYREHDAGKSRQVQDKLLNLPWPDTLEDVMRAVAMAHGGENLLNNADFEQSGSTQTDDPHADWTAEGAPDQWSLWIRNKPSDLNLSKAGVMTGVGRHGSRGAVFESGQGGVLIQSLAAKPGETFMCTAWMRAVADADAEAAGDTAANTARFANVYVGFRDTKGHAVAPDRRLYANRVFGVATDGWQRLVFQVNVPPRAESLALMLGAHPFDARGTSIIYDDPTLQRVNVDVAADTSGLKWNPTTVAAELERYRPVLAEFGIADALRWARARMEGETDWASAQPRWERRVASWRFILLGDEPADWSRWLNLEHSALASSNEQFRSGGATAQQAWARHMRDKTDLLRICDDADLRSYLFSTQGQGLYAPDGSFLPQRAEALLAGKVHQQLSLPVLVGQKDYGWVQTANPSVHFMRYVSMAWYHQRDPKWVREFQNQVLAMVMGSDKYVIAGYSTVAARLNQILPAYVLMKDSPAMSDRFHAICSRWLWAHARHLHAVGAGGYKDNTLHHTAFAQWLASSLFPEFAGSESWQEQFWPLYLDGWRHELLADNCHEQRTLAYHTNFIRRAVSLLGLAKALGVSDKLPPDFHKLLAETMDVFVAMSTPARSTPGVNDDVTVNWDYRPLLRLAGDVYGRNDWRYLATDGEEGTPPSYRSVLLPAAQLGVMRSDWSPNARWLFFKVSPPGTSHHHRDTLGIQIWAGSRKLLIEPYVGDYAFERDVYNRSWWHSTPTLGANMLPYKVQPKVLAWQTGDDLDYAVGQISVSVGPGKPPAKTRRHIFFVDRSWWVIWDEFGDLPDGQVIWENFHLATRELRIDQSGRSVMTRFADGPNLLMRVGTPGWTIQQEDTRMWPDYGHETEPTATLHFEAAAATARRGFAALFVVADGAEPPRATFEGVDRLPGGRVRLRVLVNGKQRALTTEIHPE